MGEPASGSDGAAAVIDPTARDAQLQQYWRIVVRRRSILLACVVLVMAATLVGSLLATPLYRATTTLEIAPKGPDILTFKDVLEVDSSFSGRRDFFETQYKIIQSRAVARLAVDRLDLARRPEFASRKPPALDRLRSWVGSALSRQDGSSEERPPEERAQVFISESLSVRPVRNSQLVEISFEDRDAGLAAEIANAVSDAYQQFRFEARYDTTGKAKEFLAKDVVRVQGEIAQLERNLQDLGAQKEILSFRDGSQDIREQALADINRRYTQAVGELAAAEAYLGSVRDADVGGIQEVLKSQTISNLRREQTELERRLHQMRERFDESWPALVEVRQQLAMANTQLTAQAERIATQVRSVAAAEHERSRAEVTQLGQEREALKRRVQQMNRDAIEYGGLREEIATKRAVLANLVARQSETETSFRLKDTSASSVHTVDLAETPLRPFSPNKTRNLVLALVIGFGLGLGIVFLVEHLDNTIKNERDVEQGTGWTILGRVPLTGSLQLIDGASNATQDATSNLDLASHREPRSPFSEAFRELRTSLLLATPDHPPRHVVVTSCEPEEGKSTVALNLSVVLTQLDRRVLLVDADLRRPRVHKSLGIANRRGLSSYLSGNATLDDLVQETEIPGLSVIPSGPIPPNPSELLGSPGMGTLVRFFEDDDRYDHIIFDSPPVLSVTDAIVLSSRLDATVLVARASATTRESLTAAAARLRSSRTNVIGAVLNGAVDERGDYYRRYAYVDSVGAKPDDETESTGSDRRSHAADPSRRRAG